MSMTSRVGLFVLVGGLLMVVVLLARRRDDEPDPPSTFAPELGVDLRDMDRTDSGLYIQVIEEGTGEPARVGERIAVRYSGWLSDGTRFDTTEGGEPFGVTVGEDYLVDGFMEGVEGIRVGEERLLVVKPELGYGRYVVPDVPPDSWLIFRIRRLPPV